MKPWAHGLFRQDIITCAHGIQVCTDVSVFGKWNTSLVIYSSVPQMSVLTKLLFLCQAMTAFASCALLIRTTCKDPTVMDNTLHILHNFMKPNNTMVNGIRLYQRSVDEYGKLY